MQIPFFQKNAGRDGSSPEKAIIVNNVPEEYEWVSVYLPGFTVYEQALLDLQGRPYDELKLSDPSGRERTVYFDISRFYSF